MSEALVGDLDSLEQDPVQRVARVPVASRQVEERWSPGGAFRVEPTPLPMIHPGHLWFVEFPTGRAELSPLEYRALTTANVVIYDRALSTTVARFLPLGGYAEPAASKDGVSDPALRRCLRFAREGWSVARLVDPQASPRWQRVGMMRQLSERLLTLASVDRRISVFAHADKGYESCEVPLDELGDMLDAQSCRQSLTFTIVLGAVAVGAAPRFSVASANGLAG